MEWSTHMLSGVVAGYLVSDDYKGAIVGGIAGVISYLDEPKSKFGKVFFPISYPINNLVGHRTLTHSLPFALVLGMIFYIFTSSLVAYAVTAGILAHAIGDMLTGKVKFLYPLNKSIGIIIPDSTFVLMDRLIRYSLLILICIFVFRELNIAL